VTRAKQQAGAEDLLSGALTDIAALLRGDSTAADIRESSAARPFLSAREYLLLSTRWMQ